MKTQKKDTIFSGDIVEKKNLAKVVFTSIFTFYSNLS